MEREGKGRAESEGREWDREIKLVSMFVGKKDLEGRSEKGGEGKRVEMGKEYGIVRWSRLVCWVRSLSDGVSVLRGG